jgi:hypothetical protein
MNWLAGEVGFEPVISRIRGRLLCSPLCRVNGLDARVYARLAGNIVAAVATP